MVLTQDLQLASARLELDSRRRKKDKMRIEMEKAVAHVALLRRFVIPPLREELIFTVEINDGWFCLSKRSVRLDSETAEGEGRARCSGRDPDAKSQTTCH